MTEQQTQSMTRPAAPPARPYWAEEETQGRGQERIAGILIVAAIAIALVVLVWYFVFREDGSKARS